MPGAAGYPGQQAGAGNMGLQCSKKLEAAAENSSIGQQQMALRKHRRDLPPEGGESQGPGFSPAALK